MKSYEIEFTTSQNVPLGGWTTTELEKFWDRMWTQTNFGQGYSRHVVDAEMGIVRHTVFKNYDYDPRQRDGGELDDEVEDWLKEVNDIAPYQSIDVEELPFAKPEKKFA